MRKLLGVFLAVVITLCCLPSPALAAEDAVRFSDVPADAWYAPYVEVCTQTGVIQGTGGGQFEPQQAMQFWTGTAMLMRLHHVLHGGDGILPAPPEDWPPIWVEDEAGQVLFAVDDFAGLGWGWDTTTLFFRTQQAQELDRTTGTIRLGARQFAGKFSLDKKEDDRIILTLSGYSRHDRTVIEDIFARWAIRDRYELPDWLVNAWFYGLSNGLDKAILVSSDADAFATALYQVCGELPARFSVEYVPHFDREKYPEIYSLREAGIWNWPNEAQTWSEFDNPIFTRADAAVMVARVLDESLRLESDPDALPHEGYTLTYLMDGEPPEHYWRNPATITYPVIPLEEGLLTVTGQVVPWPCPEGRPSIRECYREGEYLQAAFYTPQEPVRTNSRYGAAGCCRGPDLYGWIDSSGQLAAPLSSHYDTDPPESPVFERPYTPSEQGIYYAGERPVSQKFDWCGDLNQDLQGFVGLEGKIYRIEFEK